MPHQNLRAAVLGLLILAMAAYPYLAAANVIPSDDDDFGAPRFVVAWVVFVFFGCPGLFVLSRGGTALQLIAALLPSAAAVQAYQHAQTRAGFVQFAWLLQAALAAAVALLLWRKLAATLTRR